MRLITLLLAIIAFFPVSLYSQNNISTEDDKDFSITRHDYEKIRLPVNLYDTFEFSDDTSPHVRTGLYITAPAFFLLYGVTTWGWTLKEGFAVNPETCFGSGAVHGAADKFGHLYAGYLVKRMSTFLFRASGSSRNMANIEGAILSELVTLASEIGDGFSPYGFDPYDVVFNNIGIILGMLLDWSPALDRMFCVQIEYFPTKEMRDKFNFKDNHDLPTDYSGTKFILAAKLGGIPYLSLTPIRYLNIDLGYFSRGYNESGAKRNTKNAYVGFSLNFSIAFGDLLPVGYTSSTLQSVFNYVHVPLGYEAYRHVISDVPKEQ